MFLRNLIMFKFLFIELLWMYMKIKVFGINYTKIEDCEINSDVNMEKRYGVICDYYKVQDKVKGKFNIEQLLDQQCYIYNFTLAKKPSFSYALSSA